MNKLVVSFFSFILCAAVVGFFVKFSKDFEDCKKFMAEEDEVLGI